ncbi:MULTISPECIES: hypothetical protein [unclassified Rhizobium]|uniref:hypothetical protein n=1 Tax=unclassified Rhizobium TaxID=2613769 RepID=UPI000EA95347|nr:MULTISPECIES: hypothetical protein [unclassified Rhizobium]AYG69723.1 hypothetical protein CCGE531_26715 [Rhizobium sp. CCGE531]AYG76098.1 hypothetical protein CCGE532_26200 [Rhizobium sp. CCGE532]
MKKALIIASLALTPAVASPHPATEAVTAVSPALGDLAQFEAIANDTLKLVESGDMAAAERRITDFKAAWDAAQSQLYPLNNEEWSAIDTAADGAISSLGVKEPSPAGAKLALKELIKAMQNPSMK